MKKLLILLFGVLVGLPAISQTQLAEVIKLWKTKHVPVVDGMTYKYKLHAKSDTAIYYQVGIDTFEVTTTFKKIIKIPPVLPDVISTMDDNVVATAQAYMPAANLGDNVYNNTTWSHMKGQTWNANHHANTASILETDGYVELTCTCYKVEWWSEVRSNHGIVAISIDGGPAVNVDLYKAPPDTNNSTLVWKSPSTITSNAVRKIRVSFTGTKNPASTATNFIHDKFVIYIKQ